MISLKPQQQTWLLERFGALCAAVILFLIGIGGVRCFTSENGWLIELVSHFAPQYCLLGLLLGLIMFFRRAYSWSGLAILAVGLNAWVIYIAYQPVNITAPTPQSFSLYSANVYRFNTNLGLLEKAIQQQQPDIVFLMEITTPLMISLSDLVNQYEHQVIRPRPIVEGLMLLSRFPVLYQRIHNGAAVGWMPMLEAELLIHGKRVRFFGLHARTPKVHYGMTTRNEQLRQVAQLSRQSALPVIVAGDFNISPYSPYYREFIRLSHLINTRNDHPWNPTWPTLAPGPLGISIDHIFVSAEFLLHESRVANHIGSDHLPLQVELSLPVKRALNN